ncbi:MAG TPA: zinc-binding dehydrogenase [Thermodesulfobacteriota bacterium]|nr:zinc-binding dehydrogenase [Thermodesulfobacteriota bacterium]
MRRAILAAPGRIELVEAPDPVPGPGEVVLAVVAALTCGTDLKAWRRGHPKMPTPTPFGHEYAGVVAAVGAGVRAFREGDAVMGVPTAPCGGPECPFCRRRQENLCPQVMGRLLLGAYADRLLVPAHIVARHLFPKPAALPFEEAAALEPLACVAHSLGRMALAADDTVLVIGAGGFGLLHVAALRAIGVGRVIVAGRRAARLALARELGASLVLDAARDDVAAALAEATGGRGPDAVIECTGQPEGWSEAIARVRPGGTVCLFGGLPGGSRFPLDATRLHYDELRLLSPFHFTPADVEAARAWLSAGAVPVRSLLSGEVPLERLARAFEAMAAGEGIKYVVRP